MASKSDQDHSNDNRSNQLNPNHAEFSGGSISYGGEGGKADLDNHSNQMNPNNAKSGGGKK
jgi:hypothetical protein